MMSKIRFHFIKKHINMNNNQFYYKSNQQSYKIYLNNIQLSLKKCQIVKIYNYLELKTNDLDNEMKLSFYGTIEIILSIEEFIKLKSLIEEIIFEKNIDNQSYTISHILN